MTPNRLISIALGRVPDRQAGNPSSISGTGEIGRSDLDLIQVSILQVLGKTWSRTFKEIAA